MKYMDDVKSVIRDFIKNNFLYATDIDTLKDDDSFTQKGIIDSTGFLEVIGFIEDEFGFEVADKELIPDNFDSVDKLVAYIDRKTQTTS